MAHDVAVVLVWCAAYAAALVIDLRERRIPNWITYPLLLIGLVARPTEIGAAPLPNVIAGAVAFALFAALALRGWMGMGDAKLAAAIALASGPVLGAIALWFAFALGAVVGVALVAAGRVGRRQPVAFGPFLAVAGIAAAIAPGALLRLLPAGTLLG